MTATGSYELMIDMISVTNERRVARYSDFRVGTEASKYQLTIGGFNPTGLGTNGTYVRDSFGGMNGAKFSTFDEDNDDDPSNHLCTMILEGPGW